MIHIHFYPIHYYQIHHLSFHTNTSLCIEPTPVFLITTSDNTVTPISAYTLGGKMFSYQNLSPSRIFWNVVPMIAAPS